MNKIMVLALALVAMFFNVASAATLYPFFKNGGKNQSAEQLVAGLQNGNDQAQIEPGLMIAWLKVTHQLYTGTGTGADGPEELNTWSGMLQLLQNPNAVRLVDCGGSMTVYGLTKIRGSGSVDAKTGLLSGDVSTLTRGCYSGEQVFQLKNWNGEWVNWFSARCLNGIVPDSTKFAPPPSLTPPVESPLALVQYSQPETFQVVRYSPPETVVVNQQQWVVQYNSLPAPVAQDGWYCTRGIGEFFTCAVVLYAIVEVIDHYNDGATVAGPTIAECPGILPPGTIPAPVVHVPPATTTPVPFPVVGQPGPTTVTQVPGPVGGTDVPAPVTGSGSIPGPSPGSAVPAPEAGSVPNPVPSPGVPNPFPSQEVPGPTGDGRIVPDVPNPGGTGTPGPDAGAVVPDPIPGPVGTEGGTIVDGGTIPPPAEVPPPG